MSELKELTFLSITYWRCNLRHLMLTETIRLNRSFHFVKIWKLNLLKSKKSKTGITQSQKFKIQSLKTGCFKKYSQKICKIGHFMRLWFGSSKVLNFLNTRSNFALTGWMVKLCFRARIRTFLTFWVLWLLKIKSFCHKHSLLWENSRVRSLYL